MEKCGKFLVNDNELIALGKIPHFPWKLPQIALWKVHKLPEVNTMEKQAKCQMRYAKTPGLPQVKYGKYHRKPLVAAPGVNILFPGKARNYLRGTPGNSTVDPGELPESGYGNTVMAYGNF